MNRTLPVFHGRSLNLCATRTFGSQTANTRRTDILGKADGVQKHGWGHSYPAFIAAIAKKAQPGHIITTRHDPEASDALISLIAADVEERSGIQTKPAFEGLVMNL